MSTILVTGSVGFIGYHLSHRLLKEHHKVIGVDNINDYYDPSVKHTRNSILKNYENYRFYHTDICDTAKLKEIFAAENIEYIIQLAAQAGVRYSFINPQAYIKSNLEGFLNIIELAKDYKVKNFIYASSSSVYGGNTKLPFSETDPVEKPISLYAATKRADELIAYNYHHIYQLPTTGLRFFTVYGPLGRPDMAIFKFVKAILKDEPIDIYNNGNMGRDFTYIDDIVQGIAACLNNPFACEIINLGNSNPVELMYMIEYLEKLLNKKAKKNFLPMQPGDVERTFADISKAKHLLNFEPATTIETGLEKFVEWFIKSHKE